MKKLLLFLFITSNFISAQQYNYFEIRLVNGTIGSPQFNFTTNNITESNNSGLNAILQNHNVFSYISKINHVYPPFSDRFVELECQDCNVSQLLADLVSYSSVVAKARSIISHQTFDDALRLQITNASTGIPTGNTNGIMTTNDANLNQIFLNFNVYYYTQSFPSAINTSLLRYYDVTCDCNNILLKNALDAYNAAISATEFLSPGYLLSNTQFQKNKTIVSPNPFSDNFNIETENVISNYSLFDVSGKQIASTISKQELDAKTQSLNAGFYILNLTFEDGANANYKLVKK